MKVLAEMKMPINEMGIRVVLKDTKIVTEYQVDFGQDISWEILDTFSNDEVGFANAMKAMASLINENIVCYEDFYEDLV
ncbi:MAG: hypothetical protein K0U41_06950 [Gammaproteobacteria bacterium]|nr:hypothetical protein [Gammaproteobacteria bacterium]